MKQSGPNRALARNPYVCVQCHLAEKGAGQHIVSYQYSERQGVVQQHIKISRGFYVCNSRNLKSNIAYFGSK